MDVGEGLLEIINPTIQNKDGEQRDVEGCLSCPGEYGYVTRPMTCTVKAQDRYGNWFEKDLTGMFCRCACHETDHPRVCPQGALCARVVAIPRPARTDRCVITSYSIHYTKLYEALESSTDWTARAQSRQNSRRQRVTMRS